MKDDNITPVALKLLEVLDNSSLDNKAKIKACWRAEGQLMKGTKPSEKTAKKQKKKAE